MLSHQGEAGPILLARTRQDKGDKHPEVLRAPQLCGSAGLQPPPGPWHRLDDDAGPGGHLAGSGGNYPNYHCF